MKRKINKLFNNLVVFKYFLPQDIFERHKFISHFIIPGTKILDVGGSMSRLEAFTKSCSITTADITKPADILYDGKKIPVKTGYYNAVTAIDVLEHIPKEDRSEFIEELNRVANKLIIISAPFGTNIHLKYEKKTLKYYQERNIKLPFLEEHVKIGLPTFEELQIIKNKYNAKIFYSGDIRFTEKLFRVHNFEHKNKYLNVVFFLCKIILNGFMNLILYYFLVNRNQTKYTNRFYLVINKIKNG